MVRLDHVVDPSWNRGPVAALEDAEEWVLRSDVLLGT